MNGIKINHDNIKIQYLENNSQSVKIVGDLILKDVSGKCFSNKDMDGNLVPIEELAGIYLQYTKMFAIEYLDKNIGLLSLTNENEISIFVEPAYQRRGIGQYCLKAFEILLKERYGLREFIAETTLDNEESIRLLHKSGFESTNEIREVPINNQLVRVIQYTKKI